MHSLLSLSVNMNHGFVFDRTHMQMSLKTKSGHFSLKMWVYSNQGEISVNVFIMSCFIKASCFTISDVLQETAKGSRKVLASVDLNMKKFSSATHSQTDLMLKMKPLSVKVVEATLKLSLSCVFLKEGKATWVIHIELFFKKLLHFSCDV